jgi:thioredoxin reductase (NADPH)
MSNTRRGLSLTSSCIEKIFPKLTPAQIRRVAAHGHMRPVQRGEVLV